MKLARCSFTNNTNRKESNMNKSNINNNSEIIRKIKGNFDAMVMCIKQVHDLKHERRLVIGELIPLTPAYLAENWFKEEEKKREAECKEKKEEFVAKTFSDAIIPEYEKAYWAPSEEDEKNLSVEELTAKAAALRKEYSELQYKTAMSNFMDTVIGNWVARDAIAQFDNKRKNTIAIEEDLRKSTEKFVNILCSSPYRLTNEDYAEVSKICKFMSISGRRLRKHLRQAKH